MNECINIQLNGVESTTIYKNLNLGIYTAVILDWTGAYSDPEAYLTPLLSCSEIDGKNCKKVESVYSGSFWGSNTVEDLFLDSENLNGKERLAKLIKIEEIASELIPYIPIWISSQKAWSQNEISKPIFNGLKKYAVAHVLSIAVKIFLLFANEIILPKSCISNVLLPGFST